MSTCPVVKIKSTHPESQGAFVEINESDFDASKHELYEMPSAPAPLPPPPPAGSDVDPRIAGLAPSWRDNMKFGQLRDLANAISGRMPQNREEAIAMVVAAGAK